MTREEAIAYFKRHIDLYCVTGICREAEEMAIQALEQQPCEDAVSRKALISHIEKQSREWGEDYDAQQILGDIEDMPSVKPQERTGEWIYDYTAADGHRTYHCSKCGCFLKPKHSDPLNSFKWCSLCGAKMQAGRSEQSD